MIPELSNIFKCNSVSGNCPIARIGGAQDFSSLGGILSGLLNITITISAFLAFLWLVWGAFQYITASGDKNKLAQARARITWAIIGLIIILIAFLVAQFAQEIIRPQTRTPII